VQGCALGHGTSDILEAPAGVRLWGPVPASERAGHGKVEAVVPASDWPTIRSNESAESPWGAHAAGSGEGILGRSESWCASCCDSHNPSTGIGPPIRW